MNRRQLTCNVALWLVLPSVDLAAQRVRPLDPLTPAELEIAQQVARADTQVRGLLRDRRHVLSAISFLVAFAAARPSTDYTEHATAPKTHAVEQPADGLSRSVAWTAESDQLLAHAGFAVAAAGDVNRDGYGDVVVGVPSYDHPERDEGSAFVWYGSSSGLGPNGTPLNADWSAESNQAGSGADLNVLFGAAVSGAGDVNNDGYADVIVGAPMYNSAAQNEGAVFVYFGSQAGLGTTAGWTARDTRAHALFGASVDAADVNGDGVSDIIVGAPSCIEADILCGTQQLGRVYVWFGSSSGLGPSGTPANADWMAESDVPETLFGMSVSGAKDVNGDGSDEVLVGAPWQASGESGEGMVFVWFGSSSGLGPNGTPANADWIAEGQQPGAFLGRSVSAAGDVNKDGFGDIIVGASGFESSSAELNEGAAFVWHGSASGLGPPGRPANATWRAESNQGPVGTGTTFGWSVRDAGDVNRDGFADVLIGAPDYDHGQTDEGGAFVWYGGPLGLGVMGTPLNAHWVAESDQARARFGLSVSSAGDVNGDGVGDVIVGAPLFDATTDGEGRAFLFMGSEMGSYVSINGPALQASGRIGNGHTLRVLGDGSAHSRVGANPSDTAVASLSLPHGKRIAVLWCLVLDNASSIYGASGSIGVRLLRSALIGGPGTLPPTPLPELIAGGATDPAGMDPAFVELAPAINGTRAIVDNRSFAYWLQVEFGYGIEELRFRGCTIKLVEPIE